MFEQGLLSRIKTSSCFQFTAGVDENTFRKITVRFVWCIQLMITLEFMSNTDRSTVSCSHIPGLGLQHLSVNCFFYEHWRQDFLQVSNREERF